MSFPSLFALLFARAHLPRRRAFGQWLSALVFALAGLLGSSLAQAAVYNFNGAAVYSCSLANKVYTCPTSAYLNWDDQVIIASGYTVKVTNNIVVGYNQGLSMGSGAKLIVTGYLDISAMNPPNLKVSGGDFDVGGTFTAGDLATTMTANVTAGAIQLGPDRVTITGFLASRGLVSLSSNSRVTGNVSGTVITTGSTVTITGDVTATNRFTLDNAGTVAGKVTAPVFNMLASNSKVTGNVVATTSVTMAANNTVTGDISTAILDMQAGSTKVAGNIIASTKMTMGGNTSVTGNVDTGDLVLLASSAIITGNASVTHARLEQWGRVTGTIYCKNGTAKNKCDCVTNNSGYEVNKNNGPRCESILPKGPHHFLITHDGVGDTCVPETITVRACANATCTQEYLGGVSGKLSPFGTPFDIPANSASVALDANQFAAGAVTLDIASDSPSALFVPACYNSVKNSNSCSMEFIGGAKLQMTVPDHKAGLSTVKALVRAVKANAANTACVPAFRNVTYPVLYSCNYSKPKTGSLPVTLGGSALACSAAGATATTYSISTAFGSEGSAELALAYADAGEIKLAASLDPKTNVTASGETTFATAPASFKLVAAGGTIRAGAGFGVTITALNTLNATTRNFDTTALKNAGANDEVKLDVACHAQGGDKGSISLVSAVSFINGEAKPAVAWSDVGTIDLLASLDNFLGRLSLDTSGSTDAATMGCDGKVGPFIPHHFKLALTGSRPWFYSGEPLPLTVSAMNAGGGVTKNYTTITTSGTPIVLSEDVKLAANNNAGAAFSPAPGALDKPDIKAADFTKGVASVTPAYAFKATRTGPTEIRLRATNGKNPDTETALLVTSANPATAEEARPFIRSGRLRIGSRFGNLRGPLTIPVTAEYWTGRSWLLNAEDNHTLIPLGSFAFSPNPTNMKVRPPAGEPITLVKGAASFRLELTEGGPGWVDIAVNLGSAGKDNACVGLHPATTNAAIPWLRPLNMACNAAVPTDPAGRATFGVFTPEHRRIIHVREVFN